jgi:hypothetical protein
VLPKYTEDNERIGVGETFANFFVQVAPNLGFKLFMNYKYKIGTA